MRISFGITRLLTAAAMLGLMILAVLGFSAQEANMQGLRDASKEGIYWSASQSEAELARFVAALGRFAAGDPNIDAAKVNRRFDIVWSRMALFRQGDVGRRMRLYDTESKVIDEIDGLLQKHESSIVNIQREGPADLHRKIMAEFTEAGEHLRALSVQILAAEEARLAGVRDNVRSSARLTWVVSMAALVLAMVLIGVMLIETRRYRRMASESAELAARAEAASSAKSRFLTMMSHELRTPMNGVLGLLALVRQTALNERQSRLVDQAARAGRQMSALLGDILDFSDLQSESLVVGRDMFEVRALADAVQQMFGPMIQREGVTFAIDIADSTPRWVVGDLARLRQVLGHFITYLIDTVGTHDVRLAISGSEGTLLFAIDVAAEEGDRPGWQPEAIFGRSSAQYGQFASDSLGPMIARGLVTLMGGTVELARPASDRAVLSVSVPLEAADGPAAGVRIDAQSVTVKTVLTALLRKLDQTPWSPDTGNQGVGAVLMEAGGSDETARAARLRSAHPAARLIAVGAPERPEMFDHVCAQPLGAEALAAALAAPGPASRFQVS